MAIGTRSWARSYVFSGGLPPGIRMLLIVNIGIFLLQFFLRRTALGEVFSYGELIPAAVVKLFFVWQLATYMFLHSGIGHILWNMLALWMFGVELERMWGTRRFLQFYFFCGIGAGVCVVVGNYLFGNPNVATVGSSGAIYGILLASAVLWPDRQILFSFLIPIKMKYFVIIIGEIAFLNSFNPASPVSDVAHLGGMLFGYVFLRMPRQSLTGSRRGRPGISFTGSLRETYRNWKLARAKRKFDVYMRKQKSDRDRWVN
jgi:membrane associated rhomboid family serine protease